MAPLELSGQISLKYQGMPEIITIFSPDAIPVGKTLAAGPGIRYYQIAKCLAQEGFKVRLLVPAPVYEETIVTKLFHYGSWELNNLKSSLADTQVVILPQVHSGLSSTYPSVAPEDLPTVVDLYDPVLIENIGLQPKNESGFTDFINYLSGVRPIFSRGDLFLYANSRQRYYYLGILNVIGTIEPLNFDEQLLLNLPFGIESQPPKSTKTVMRNSLVKRDDKVILWFSGIYPWFDALTLIKAMPIVVEKVPNAKLVILGGKHPRRHAPTTEYEKAQSLVNKLGLEGNTVHFVDWQPYHQRANWYLEADVAVTLHKQSLETELSNRTRIIDFLWAGLPTVVSKGDEIGNLLEKNGAGLTVPVGDHQTLAYKLAELLSNPEQLEKMKSSALELAKRFHWQQIVKPLVNFCRHPHLAKDRQSQENRAIIQQASFSPLSHNCQLTIFERLKSTYSNQGILGLAKKAANSSFKKIKGS